MNDPFAYTSKLDKYTMYFYQDMQHPDKAKFFKSVMREFNGQLDKKHWILIPKEDSPKVVQFVVIYCKLIPD